MKKTLWTLACMTVLIMPSCEKDPDMDKLDSQLTVYTDYDKDADFSAYRTYFLPDSILEANGVHATYWKDENAKAIIDETEAKMNSRGYTRITDPKLKDKADVGLQLSYLSQSTTVVSGSYPGYYGGWWDYGFWGAGWNGWYYPYPVTYSYDTNALILEMVDLQQKGNGSTAKLPVVWYASASGFRYGNNRANMQLLLNGVDQAFEQFDNIDRK